MMNVMAQWEDESNNRQIHFSVDYTIDGSTIVINSLTPDKVTFIDPENNSVVKSKGIHTDKARKMLADQFTASGQLDEFVNELGRRNGLLATV